MGRFDFMTYVIQTVYDGWQQYTNPEDTEEDDEYETVYVTQIRFQEPVRPNKVFLVSEMPDFFTDAELNEGYHSKQDYVQANDKYGYIYKYQKFENADTVEKLQEYATDWIKNNYYGGLSSFDISALDMYLMDENSELDPYMVGDRTDVYYPDPDSQTEVCKTLCCISAEYDLYSPDKTRYKIGIPDSALNKVYGETTKSGGGGGGGGNTEDENDEEDDKKAETNEDLLTKVVNYLTENGYSFFSTWLPGGEDGTETSDPNLETPKKCDITNPFQRNLTADNIKAAGGEWAKGVINNLSTKYTNVSGTLSSVVSVVKDKLKSKDVEVSNNLDVTGVADLSTLKINGTPFRPFVENGKVKLTIGNNTYTITPD